MADVVCRNCGARLDESPSLDPERQPCPKCGSTSRKFGVEVSLHAAVSVTGQLVGLLSEGHKPSGRISATAGSANSGSTAEAQGIGLPLIPSNTQLFPPTISGDYPDVVIQAVLKVGERIPDGSLIAGVAVPWFEIVRHLRRDPAFLYQIPWRQLEELIAGAYMREGWTEVVLTPRSGDGGRDIIASKPGLGSIRILDQIKAYRPGQLVKANEVRAMLGVLEAEQNVSKGFVTTTSSFAPGIDSDPRLSRFMPYRLELKRGEQLLEWLTGLAETK